MFHRKQEDICELEPNLTSTFRYIVSIEFEMKLMKYVALHFSHHPHLRFYTSFFCIRLLISFVSTIKKRLSFFY